ncbi:protein synthesis inhibitor II-like [Miscanthus floridulus]|uniref:protein synthesis inhibitor II-like n=1 Tax=Miscanthus floridulus TaxID=154761 RepID=UPI003458C19C
MEAAIETIEYDVAEENYGEFIEVLRRVLAEYEPVGDRQSVVDFHHAPHPVLPRQRSPHRPARWIHVTLQVRNEGHATTLAIRDDNVYLIGFRNRRGQCATSATAASSAAP